MWTRADIAGKPADVFEPAAGRPRFALLFLHPSSGTTLIDKPVYSRLFEQHRLACVCPRGESTWWTDKVCLDFDPQVTAEQYLLKSVLPLIQERWGLPPRSVGLFGIGMGGQGALRVAFKHPRDFPVVAGLASALDCHELYGQGRSLDDLYDSKEQCRQDTALLHVHPSHYPPHIFFCADPDDHEWQRGNDRLQEKLAALGIPHEMDLATRAGGHSWDYFNHMAERVVDFLIKGLEMESRRLL